MPNSVRTTLDHDHWQSRLDDLRAEHRVPGATLAVLKDGEIHEFASGILHRGTGVEATTGSVFQLGSIAKVYTASLVMGLAEDGRLDLDAPVIEVLPEFATVDPEATKTITARQLLSHTGGLTCDFLEDTGRGDDCLAKYVEAARGVALDCPPGTAASYSSVGYNVLGRIVEVLTGLTWDDALRARIVTPLGLTETMTLPEEALRFRVAMGHLGKDPEPTAAWDLLPRSAGPYGRVLATAGDVVRFARMLLDGTAADGARVLAEETVTAMRRREVEVPDKWTLGSDGWGLGLSTYDWNGVAGFGHNGSSIGQRSYLRVVPEAGFAFALLTNHGTTDRLYTGLSRELLGELAGVRVPADFVPPPSPPSVDVAPFAGIYRREGVIITVTEKDGKLHFVYEFADGLEGIAPPIEAELVPVAENVFAGMNSMFGDDWMPVLFTKLPDGTACCYTSMRVAPKIA
ncbi:penicillin-binding protein [Amycolatopsis sp. WAC 01375]|uniref:serine hydrolase domain-containing protein n=1 Tax=Amycolatopsis sp. WAC 01375 TaxID=2203194 RepID=UPI000F77C310|nr:serine hydrolase domain-containing protein [Amycolatopsis sp. WAC 01375]RSM68378.1 penicillin-binding protein [Amycolatopsis sp. WAC 01375]